MMTNFDVEIEFSFIDHLMQNLQNPSEENLDELVEHKAAKDVYAHATMFSNTSLNLKEFWREIILKEKKDKGAIDTIVSKTDYIRKNKSCFTKAFEELKAFIPDKTNIQCNLFLIIGYDIGIVSKGNAFLNIIHSIFKESSQEMIYFSMHELHHVVYTFYQPMFSYKDIKNTADFFWMVKYLTHLEGLAVYCSYEKRIREKGITHKDYIALENEQQKLATVEQYFEIYKSLKRAPKRPVSKEDFEILKIMGGGPRLWYVTGGHMAKEIDRSFGREKLLQTMINGCDEFFKLYFLINK